MSKIYMIERDDYDGHIVDGYFTNLAKAKACCEYNNRCYPSSYYEGDEDEEFMWKVIGYNLDETDYNTLLKELDQQAKIQRRKTLRNELSDLQRQMQGLQTRINALTSELSEQKEGEGNV